MVFPPEKALAIAIFSNMEMSGMTAMPMPMSDIISENEIVTLPSSIENGGKRKSGRPGVTSPINKMHINEKQYHFKTDEPIEINFSLIFKIHLGLE